MSWINMVDESNAEGQLKEVYSLISAKRGGLANVIKAHSLNPKVMLKHFELYMSLMFSKSPLSRREREMIATVVSSANKCLYCKTHHGQSLKRLTKDEMLVENLRADWTEADLTEREKAICSYVVKLALTPAEIVMDDIEALRKVGFEDKGIHDIVATTSYFCFVNRMVLGLGVEVESDYEKTC